MPDIAIADFAITALGLLLAATALFLLLRVRHRRHRLVALLQRLVGEERRVAIAGIVETAVADAALMEAYAYGAPPAAHADGGTAAATPAPPPPPHTRFATPSELARMAVPDLLAAYEEVQRRGARAAEAYLAAAGDANVGPDFGMEARQARARKAALSLPAEGRESAFMQQDAVHSVALTRASLMEPLDALQAMLRRAEFVAEAADPTLCLKPCGAAGFRKGLTAHLQAHLGTAPSNWAAEAIDGSHTVMIDTHLAAPPAASGGAAFLARWWGRLVSPGAAVVPAPTPAAAASKGPAAPARAALVADVAAAKTAVASLSPRHREVAAQAALFSAAHEAQLDDIAESALMSPFDAGLAWLTHRLGDKVKILFSFFQILVLLPSVYQTAWPGPFVSFLNVFSVLALDYWAIIPIDCAFPRTFYLGLYVVSLLPIAVIMLAWAVLLIVWAALPWRKRSAGGRLAGHSASLIDYGIKVSIYILFIVYPSVSRTTLSYFSCVPRGSVGADGASSLYVMQYAQATPCYDDAWYLNVVAAWIFIAVYPIGVVVLFALVLGERGGVGAQSPSSHRASLPT